MKGIISILLSVVIFSCSQTIFQQSSSEGKYFESSRGPLFAGNQIWFNKGNTFRYIGHGSSIFLSMGYWKYDESKNEIVLSSDISFKPTTTNPIDTMWVDLSGKRIKIKSEKKILFEEVTYNLKQ